MHSNSVSTHTRQLITDPDLVYPLLEIYVEEKSNTKISALTRAAESCQAASFCLQLIFEKGIELYSTVYPDIQRVLVLNEEGVLSEWFFKSVQLLLSNSDTRKDGITLIQTTGNQLVERVKYGKYSQVQTWMETMGLLFADLGLEKEWKDCFTKIKNAHKNKSSLWRDIRVGSNIQINQNHAPL